VLAFERELIFYFLRSQKKESIKFLPFEFLDKPSCQIVRRDFYLDFTCIGFQEGAKKHLKDSRTGPHRTQAASTVNVQWDKSP
jgi:hypothetical protein